MKILIVDDDLSRYGDVVPELQSQNDTVDAVTNVKSALLALDEKSYDILVVDMMLPQTTWDTSPNVSGGVEILRHLQEDESISTPTFVLGITGATDDDPNVLDFFEASSWILIRATPSSNWQARLRHFFMHAREAAQRVSARTFGVDVCIVNALAKPEQKAVLSLDIKWEVDPILCDSSTFVRRGSLTTVNGKSLSIISACAMRMGGIETAILSTKLIEIYRPRMLMMTGICAGVKGKTEFGDVIVAHPTWDWTNSKWDVDEAGEKRILPAPDYIDVEREIVAKLRLIADDAPLMSRIQDAWQGEESPSRLKMHLKPCASGPIVVADGETLQKIQTLQNRDVHGLEMEAYGLYSAARAAAMPRPMVVSLKGVCDFADPRKGDKAQAYAAYTSARVAFEYLRRFGVSSQGG